MAYVGTATGLEAAVVFLLGVENLYPPAAEADRTPGADAGRREENAPKLYMAMTRAGQRLILISCRPLPAAMERLFTV
jgi:superfamily I DNA/RNA helicase